jgi:hypothetical protein
MKSDDTNFLIASAHLRQSGLTQEGAKSLLERPYAALLASERRNYVLLKQTPVERAAWIAMRHARVDAAWAHWQTKEQPAGRRIEECASEGRGLGELAEVGTIHADTFISVNDKTLRQTNGGREASVFSDKKEGVVYKVFDGGDSGSVGIQFGIDDAGQLGIVPSTEENILEKIFVINALGGMPTEVFGKTQAGDIVVKQPLGAYAGFSSLAKRNAAQRRAHLVHVPNSILPSIYTCYYSNIKGVDFLIGDLHSGNYATDKSRVPRFIDLIASRITPKFYTHFSELRKWIDVNRAAAAAPSAATFLRSVAGGETPTTLVAQ